MNEGRDLQKYLLLQSLFSNIKTKCFSFNSFFSLQFMSDFLQEETSFSKLFYDSNSLRINLHKKNIFPMGKCFCFDLILKEWKTAEIIEVICVRSEKFSKLGYPKSTLNLVPCSWINSEPISLLSLNKFSDTLTK